MTKLKFSESVIVAPSIFATHLVNGTQFPNATVDAICPIIVISPLIRI